MKRHAFLQRLHEVYRPRTYLEVGVSKGQSLKLSKVPSIGIDPAFNVQVPLKGEVQLVRSTSDDFFARRDPLAFLQVRGKPAEALARRNPLGFVRRTRIDLAFIDGMHLFEYALRDFTNVERHCRWSSVIVFDDVLPRNCEEATRERHTKGWTGDVFKVTEVLRRRRPDLVTLLVDVEPTGALVVLGADPRNRTLHRDYAAICVEQVTPDPQVVPEELLRRDGTLSPEEVLASAFWARLVRARNLGRRRSAWEQLRPLLPA